MKVKQQVWKTGKIALIFFAIGVLLGTVISYSATSNTFTISPGIYPGAPSYTIYKIGSTYYAKNANGAIDYSGTNASQIVQNSLDAGQGIVFLRDAIYSWSTVTLGSGDLLIGESHSVVLQRTGTAVTMLKAESVSNVAVRNLVIDGGQNVHSLNKSGIWFDGVNNGWIIDVEVKNCADDGISVDWIPNTGKNIWIERVVSHDNKGTAEGITLRTNGTITKCLVYGNAGDGILIKGDDVTVSDNSVYGNTYSGIVIGSDAETVRNVIAEHNLVYSNGANGIAVAGQTDSALSTYVIVSSNHVSSNTDDGIEIDGLKCLVSDNTIRGNGKRGILIDGANNTIVSGNLVESNGVDGVNTHGILLNNAWYVNVYGNNAIDDTSPTQSWGIYEGGTSDYNVIISNICRDNSVGGIKIVGAHTHCNLCYNGTAWIS